MGGKDIGSSIGWTALLLTRVWIVFIRARTVAAHNNPLMVLRLVLIVSQAT